MADLCVACGGEHHADNPCPETILLGKRDLTPRERARDCPIDQRPCDHALCLRACAKQTLPNRCAFRGCIRDASAEAGGRTPRLVYYPVTEWQDAKGAPIDLKLHACKECAASVTLRQIETEGLRNLARNLLKADGRSEPDFTRTRLYFLPIGVLREPAVEGINEPAKERSRVIRWD